VAPPTDLTRHSLHRTEGDVDRIVILSGQINAGKSTLAAGLADRFGMRVFRTKDAIRARAGPGGRGDRKRLQAEGARLDSTTGGAWVVQDLNRWVSATSPGQDIVVDSARVAGQVTALREAFGARVVHIHLTAPDAVLSARHGKKRRGEMDRTVTYAQTKDDSTERQVESLGQLADAVIDTNRCTEEDVLARASSVIRPRAPSGLGHVDVVVGGEYGSEGKGQIVSRISKDYDILVRVGGPNAGHKVYGSPPYTHHQLPSGTRFSEARLLIGPGAVLHVPKLLKEISECAVDAKRLVIDRHAMVIEPADIAAEQQLVDGIGSTGSGTGAATARRIMGRSGRTRLAQDAPELRPFLGDSFAVLEEAYHSGKRILLEGTQGTGLSLYHGTYPYVTSRDTTTMGCLAEAGIPPRWVRKVLMVCRTYPIRVQSPRGGTSGPLRAISWSEVSRRSGIRVSELRSNERTSTTHRRRRVGEFDWALLRRASLLNGATDIALTFTDYVSVENRKANRFDQLTPETIRFIDEIERVSGAPVSMVATGFNNHSVIDRRAW
jgi:adenylosuccinate synthase